jgi:hypothetical protein
MDLLVTKENTCPLRCAYYPCCPFAIAAVENAETIALLGAHDMKQVVRLLGIDRDFASLSESRLDKEACLAANVGQFARHGLARFGRLMALPYRK